MRDLLPDIERWRAAGHSVAVATVVNTQGSAPRPTGSKLAVASHGEFVGSVSGGCVEPAVIDVSLDVLRTGQPQLLQFGITRDMVWDIGLACGGTIEVFVEPLESQPNHPPLP